MGGYLLCEVLRIFRILSLGLVVNFSATDTLNSRVKNLSPTTSSSKAFKQLYRQHSSQANN
jgi:hypothetical protein